MIDGLFDYVNKSGFLSENFKRGSEKMGSSFSIVFFFFILINFKVFGLDTVFDVAQVEVEEKSPFFLSSYLKNDLCVSLS